ncbi:capsular polysaccharide export protein, LipB/KpsS family [Asaia krungthepensis]|uniref:capsular polysaccharide export protein, LipB/KpsS family n=1 Tax=Asaia krungthepensis TaxID=220990 RepID=UPI002232196A|nr:hypothetical protein [Asaia krungthepensis]
MMRRQQCPLPVLLRAPPFRPRLPDLGVFPCSWEEFEADSFGGDPETALSKFEELARRRLGGDYTNPHGLKPDSSRRVLLELPSNPLEARQAWRIAKSGWYANEITVSVSTRSQPSISHLLRGAAAEGARIVRRPINPHALLEHSAVVLTFGMGDLGLLGLAYDRAVWCMDKKIPSQANRLKAASAIVYGTRYHDPFFGTETTFDDILVHLSDWRDIVQDNREIAACMGMAWWKKARMRQFLAQAPGSPRFMRHTASAVRAARDSNGAVACWSTRVPSGLEGRVAQEGQSILRIEDGFIRSLGLGSDLLPPASIVLDKSGIYYDPASPSDLETILSTQVFDPLLIERARCLARRIVEERISKYGTHSRVEAGTPIRVKSRERRHVILVPGQVSDDQSVLKGGAGVYSNLELIRRVRQVEPDAWIIYRPHPDVDAGHRAGAIADDAALLVADEIHRGGSMPGLLGEIDEVHTLTSLTGFEALMRGIKVSTWGQPFYSGWGLTTDFAAPTGRRNRILTLEELIAATLIIYPRYLDPVSGLPCSPETLIGRLGEPGLWRTGMRTSLRRKQGALTKNVTKFCHELARVFSHD